MTVLLWILGHHLNLLRSNMEYPIEILVLQISKFNVNSYISLTIIRNDRIHKGHKEVLGIFGSSASEVGTERVQH